jgi:ABC-type polysaccharide/polyol phosphate export permease
MILLGVVLFGLRLHVDATSALTLIAVIPASIALFVSFGVVCGAFTVLFKETTAMLAFAATALSVFGGVFFPTAVMPRLLESLADALPFTWALDVLRAVLLEGDVPEGRLFLLLGVTPLAVLASLWLFNGAIERAKKQGTLGQY